MIRSHITQALEVELASPRSNTATITGLPERAEDAAFAAGSALLFMAANTAVPVAGGVAAAVTVCELQRARKAPEDSRGATSATSKAYLPHVLESVDEQIRCRTLTVPAETEATSEGVKAWNAWLPWDDLHDGAHVPVPVDLPHPREAGFRKTSLAKSVGQVGDWVRGLTDGSRLHVHEFAANDGHSSRSAGASGGANEVQFEVHRDKLDPSRDPVTATVHWLAETDEGTATMLAGLTFFAVWWGLKGAILARAMDEV